MASVTNCSRPSIRFTFDLLKILRTVPKKIEIPLPDGENKAPEGYHGFTRDILHIDYANLGANGPAHAQV
jgi:hypothetical protein